MESIIFRKRKVNLIHIDSNSELGFNFPFKIILPEKLNDNPDLIVACTLPKDYSDSCATLDELIKKTDADIGSIDPMHIHLSLDNCNPLFIPLIPRIRGLRTGFLGRDLFTNDFKVPLGFIDKNECMLNKNDVYQFTDLANQYNSMLQYAIGYLKNNGINVDDRVIISGYSEGAKFSSHFALLHPEIIKAVVSGGTGGCISMPISNLDGYEFTFPTGISDVDNFNRDSFNNISFFYYMGDKDKSDSAMPYFKTVYYMDDSGEKRVLRDECGNETPKIDEFGNRKFILDENGNYMAKYSLFSNQEVNAINKTLGTITQERFKKQEEIYKSLGLNCTFNMYPGNHRTIFDDTTKLFADVDDFLEKLKKTNQKQL